MTLGFRTPLDTQTCGQVAIIACQESQRQPQRSCVQCSVLQAGCLSSPGSSHPRVSALPPLRPKTSMGLFLSFPTSIESIQSKELPSTIPITSCAGLPCARVSSELSPAAIEAAVSVPGPISEGDLTRPLKLYGEDALLDWPGAMLPVVEERDLFMAKALAAAATGARARPQTPTHPGLPPPLRLLVSASDNEPFDL